MRISATAATRLAAFFSAALAVQAGVQGAGTIFDDFNVNEGHFNVAPNFSGTTVGESSASTADRVTNNGPLEGAGHQKLVLVHDGTPTNLRVRHLSGSGTVANNTAFTTTAGTDAYIGFYLKTTATGITAALNLDGAGGTAAEMDMGKAKSVLPDGQWHLYEWNLNAPADWAAVTAIGGDGVIQDGSHTIDSIYFFDGTGAAEEAKPDIYLDFVAYNPGESIAALVPEPASLGLAAVSALTLLMKRRRTIRPG